MGLPLCLMLFPPSRDVLRVTSVLLSFIHPTHQSLACPATSTARCGRAPSKLLIGNTEPPRVSCLLPFSALYVSLIEVAARCADGHEPFKTRGDGLYGTFSCRVPYVYNDLRGGVGRIYLNWLKTTARLGTCAHASCTGAERTVLSPQREPSASRRASSQFAAASLERTAPKE